MVVGATVVVVVAGAVVVVLGTTVVVVVLDATVVVVVVGATVVVVVVGATVVVVVVVVVGGGVKKGPPQPQRMSTGAPSGVPAVSGRASRAVRSCVQPSHADTPVVGQPPRTCVHAAV